jgi:hypothetical protein
VRFDCLQIWPHFENVKEAAQNFTQYAQDIIDTSNLDTVAEPYTVLQKKLAHIDYVTWRKKLTEWTFLSLLGYKCRTRGRQKPPTAKEAKQKLEAIEPGQNLVQKLQAWTTACRMELPPKKYNNLEEAEAIAWNWWLDKIMDHTRTVSRNDGIAAAANGLVSCPLAVVTRLITWLIPALPTLFPVRVEARKDRARGGSSRSTINLSRSDCN